MGWLGMLIYISLLLEFRPMEHLPGTALLTVAEGTKRDWQSVPPEMSQVTSIHIFLAKPSPTVMPKFTWVRKYDSTRWSEGEEDQILGNKPNSATSTSRSKKQCLHPSLWQDEGVLSGNLGVYVIFGGFVLKPRNRGCFLLSSKGKVEQLQK